MAMVDSIKSSSSKEPGIVNVVGELVPWGVPWGVPDSPDAWVALPESPDAAFGAFAPDAALEVDVELAGASNSIELEGLLPAGANLTFPIRATSTFLLFGRYIRTSDLPMYPVR